MALADPARGAGSGQLPAEVLLFSRKKDSGLLLVDSQKTPSFVLIITFAKAEAM